MSETRCPYEAALKQAGLVAVSNRTFYMLLDAVDAVLLSAEFYPHDEYGSEEMLVASHAIQHLQHVSDMIESGDSNEGCSAL